VDELLRVLLNQLGRIGEVHEEIYDTECRDRMSSAIFDGFIRPLDEYVLPSDFGMYSPGVNIEVRKSLEFYIHAAKSMFSRLPANSFHERLSAFQNGAVKSEKGDCFDDLFGYSHPNAFNNEGNIIETP
jgi:hypothetical protein